MHVAFINENTLGHASYLPAFAEAFEHRPELGIVPHRLDATPLPASNARWANFSVPGLRRWGLDFHNARWRLAVSRHVGKQVEELRQQTPLEAVVVNTQSVALALIRLDQKLPLFVCLDATFEQLARSLWFAPNAASRWFLPLTLAPLRERERRLYERADRLLGWSAKVTQSLQSEYCLPAGKITVLPPSLALAPRREKPNATQAAHILFVGGDFRRKGGPLLLECFRRHLRGQAELHILTESPVEPEPGIHVYRGLKARTEAWQEQWARADLFVFPSTLETFGIVLVEALAFEVPVISAGVGAAREILAGGEAGWLLSDRKPDTWAAAIQQVLAQPALARAKTERGRQIVERQFNLATNAERLAEWLHAVRRVP